VAPDCLHSAAFRGRLLQLSELSIRGTQTSLGRVAAADLSQEEEERSEAGRRARDRDEDDEL
jgi:hypothetical protein